MKINFDSINAKHNVDRVTTSQIDTKTSGTKQIGAYALDISGTVMDNSAYSGQGKTAEDVMLNAEQGMMDAQQDLMTVMSNFMSTEDYERLAEGGFNPSDVDTSTIVTVVDEIKAKLAEAGIEIEGYNDDLSDADLERITGSAMRGRQISEKLKENDIPASKENITDVESALEKNEQLAELSDSTKKYLLLNQKDLTIDETYCAKFSNTTKNVRQGYGYYSDDLPGYYAKKADNYNWDQIDGQIKNIINDSKLEVNDTTLEESKWLIEKGIPLTVNSLEALDTINQLTIPLTFDKAMNTICNAYMSGKSAEEALLTDTETYYTKAAEYIEKVKSISDQALMYVVQNQEPLTIYSLVQADQNTSVDDFEASDKTDHNMISKDPDDSELRLLSARRLLEETRLQMTFSANIQLLKKGYSIDTTELSQLVEDLKTQEQLRKEVLFQTSDTQVLEERENIYQNTLTVANNLPQMPVQIVGTALLQQEDFNIQQIHEEGSILKTVYEKAGTAYETLMTSPRSELGDSIRKAFQNTDELLMNMNMECNETNRRAVRILSYNDIEVNEENLTSVKDADLALRRVINKLTPGTTLNMIRDGQNPLAMNVKQLDDYLTDQTTETEETEKYSAFLYKLEQKNEITQEERESFIGIYRLLRQVEKTDGAVIGSLVNQGAELNFKNLLSAVRTNRHSQLDYTVDDSFSGVDGTISNSITSQIESYYNRLVNDTKDHCEPYKMTGMLENSMTSLETIHEQLLSQESSEENKVYQEQLFEEKIQEARSIKYVDDAVVQTLLDYEQPVTVDNLLSLQLMQQSRGSIWRNIYDRATEESDSDAEQFLASLDELQEGLTDAKTANDSYDFFARQTTEILDHIEESSDHYIDIKSISNFRKQLQIASNLAKSENYEIPVFINGKINSINLQIEHNSENSGQVQITFTDEVLGDIQALFQVSHKDDEQKLEMEGIVAGTEDEGIFKLKALEEKIRSGLNTEICEIKSIYFTSSDTLDINSRQYSHKKTSLNNASSNKTENVTNGTLYQIAKSFIQAIKNKGEAYED